MEPAHRPSNASRAVKAAPFTWGRRRLSIFGTVDNVADALRATRQERRLSSAAQEPPSCLSPAHRLHGRCSGRLGGPALDMAAAVRERARQGSVLDADSLPFAPTEGATPPSVSFSLTPGTLSTSLPPLSVEPVPECLAVLRYTRSARAWDTLAAGCLAEATRLSEKDNDFVSWAACLILSGDAQRGLMLLESYVVATCVVVHEVLTGVLGVLPKGVHPPLKGKDGRDRGTAKADLAAHPYAQRKCRERHNQVLMVLMRCRTTFSERSPAELLSYDVNVHRTPQALVQEVVLQAMQLVDAAEVQRWYIVALVLFTPADVSGSNETTVAADGDGRSRTQRRGSRATAADGHEYVKKHQNSNDDSGSGPKSNWTRALPAGDRGKDTDSVWSQAGGAHRPSSATADSTKPKTRTSASDGYRAPRNLWFRYFFALDDCSSPVTTTTATSTTATDTQHRRSPTTARKSTNKKQHDSDGGPATPHEAVPTSSPAHSQGKKDVSPSYSSPLTTGRGEAQPTVMDERLPSPPACALQSSECAAVAELKDSGRKGSFAFQSGSKLARTLSWFRDRSKGAAPLSARSAALHLHRNAPLNITAPTWHLPATASLDQEQTCSLLLSHREEWDVYFITAMTAFYTQHYRTCMMAASRFLQWAEVGGGVQSSSDAASGGSPSRATQNWKSGRTFHHTQNGEPTRPAQSSTSQPFSTVPGLRRYQHRFALFLRAWSALQIGERLQAGKDIIALMEDKEDSLCYHVGCALALYGLPLPQAKDALLTATHTFTNAAAKTTGPDAPSGTSFSTVVQGYLYVLTEAIHATTLLQLGLVQQTIAVATAALQRAERSELREEDTMPLGALRDVVVLAATAMEDSRVVLDVSLSPDRLVYVAVCPAFFGGLCASGIRVKAHSATHRILYPQNVPLYASTRRVIPFHMNRAMFLFHAGQVDGAWDDVCCAVAAVDEIVGSVEFAFSDCFPLRVYYFAIHVGLTRLEDLLAADLEAAKACLANPTDQQTMERKDAQLQENELLSKEIMHICQGVVLRMQQFFPHARVTALCRAHVAIVCGGQDYIAEAVAISRRYPHSPSAQNILTLALYFGHHIPEAVDNARKNLQTFPHSSAVIQMHRLVQKKHITYNFNYRKLVPLQYKPGSHDRVFTKRMIIVLILLAANLVVLCLTAYVNTPSIRDMPDGLRYLAVRMQLPTVVPLFFAAVFVMHAIVAAITTKNLISTLLTDLFFVNTSFNRALFCLRCLPLVNLVNALLISVLGNNFLFESGSATFVLYFILAILFVPFTTRIWFLPSVDEPDAGFMTWLAILSVDSVITVFIVIPHIIAAFLEPYMLVLFYFFAPTQRPGNDRGFQPPSSSIRRRLLLHAHESKFLPPRFTTGSGSRFVHIVALRWLYVWSHCTLETRFLAESQLEEECYRVFPLVEGAEAAVLYAHVSQAPLCAAMAAVEEKVPNGVDHRRSQSRRTRHSPAATSGAQVRRKNRGHSGPASPSSTTSTSCSSLSASSSSPSSSEDDVASGSASSNDSRFSSFFTSSDASDDSFSDEREGSDGDSNRGGADGTPLAGVRTVDAMRKLLHRSTRKRTATMRPIPSFVRPNPAHSLTSLFTGRSDVSGSQAEGEEERRSSGNGRTRRAGSTGGEVVNGCNDATQHYRGGGSAASARPLSQGSPSHNAATLKKQHNDEAGRRHHRNDSSTSSSSGHSSEVASYHADEELGLRYQRHCARVDETGGEAAAFSPSDAHTDPCGPRAQAPRPFDANYLYTDAYAAQNRFGWYTNDGAGSNANQHTRRDADALDF
ncbi:hypothetical protein ABB37_00838 [Leptomonas pyrrhocoris]|uniref:Uncharacterized protein n=1 Tax=Leptomonas pyrrhocoris TaxID=157538 RepID=A0A0M9GB65_LEPPY|nr:hypothetical protein ABB37_00838 [Leptomonas pyrrhocoris]KPA86770.1 hypothetical protein ABB37_00838 [Leptomonas pyrrhocoris]|eukprot:XP_015665209.1 hypothetical protein ABB37_00838 [Leptomonas pyrrhocoris]